LPAVDVGLLDGEELVKVVPNDLRSLMEEEIDFVHAYGQQIMSHYKAHS
jgi:hypothetical protein